MKKTCKDCKKSGRHYAKGLCERCWRRAYSRAWMRRLRAAEKARRRAG